MLTNIQDTIRTLIIPLASRNLLLPNVAVAEVIPYIRPRAIADAPEWLLGAISWRGLNIPLISFDRLHGMQADDTRVQARIAVFNSVRPDGGLSFYAVVTAGIPQLKRLKAETIQESSAEAVDSILAQVQVGDITAAIPDLAALESAVADCWKQVA